MSELVTREGEADVGVLVHGGAGAVADARRDAHVEGCQEAARVGFEVLERGGSALDAVQAAARWLEDLPQFNAGTGAALNADGDVEHDAAIMEGENLRAGAVCALGGYKNPIDIARAVLEQGRHVLYAGQGAARFAREHGFSPAPEGSLVTPAARDALAKALATGQAAGWAGGTIGAVARDAAGHVAAATSTGGIVAKLAGRVGDSPILGAGTLADDESCALSATGDGEPILRIGLAHHVAHALRGGATPAEAASSGLNRLRARLGSTGGLILIDRSGRFAFAHTTATMSWAIASRATTDAGI